MADAKSDGILEIFVIFLVELRFFFVCVCSLLHLPAAEKNPVGPPKNFFALFFRPSYGGEKTPKKEKKRKRD